MKRLDFGEFWTIQYNLEVLTHRSKIDCSKNFLDEIALSMFSKTGHCKVANDGRMRG